MILETDIGPITLGYKGENLICEFGKHKTDHEPSKKLSRDFKQYFAGKFMHQFDVPIPEGTPFMQKCWAACRNIPYGETRTYGELAKAVGSPKGARAAGQAMRHNPLPIVTPCHRVIATSGKLHGFTGKTDLKSKELKIKQYLLQLERITTMRVS